MNVATPTLADLLNQRVHHKRDEDAAAEKRKAIDSQIATMLFDPAKPTGSVTQKAGGLKVTVIYGVTRSVDTEALQNDYGTLTKAACSAFRFKAEVVADALNELDGHDLLLASKYITSKPKSPSVTLAVA